MQQRRSTYSEDTANLNRAAEVQQTFILIAAPLITAAAGSFPLQTEMAACRYQKKH